MKTIVLHLEITDEEYKTLKKVEGVKNLKDLKEELNGALNNWLLDLLLSQ